MYCQSNNWWIFHKIMWPSQNIWTLWWRGTVSLFRVIWKFQVMVFTKAHEGERVISPSGFHYLWFATKCTFDPFRPFISNPRNVRFVSNLEGENCTGDLSRKGKLLFYLGSLEFFLLPFSLSAFPWENTMTDVLLWWRCLDVRLDSS